MSDNISLPWGSLSGIRPVKRVVQMKEKGMTDDEITKVLTEQFSVSQEKINLAIDIADREIKVFPKPPQNSCSLYLDIPFCPSKCIYCSFASMGVDQMKHFVEPYLEAMFTEIDETAKIVRDLGFKVDTVYIGGGTPTTLSAEDLDRLLYKISQKFDLKNLKEFTVEAGRPDTITASKLLAMRRNGVDRISVNPQSMNEKTLKIIGRKHSPEQIERAMELVRKHDFCAVNMDVIAGLPEETTEEFSDSLIKVAAFEPENITVHTMCIKRAARLTTEEQDLELSEDMAVQNMVRFAHRLLKEKDYHPYYLYRQKKTLGNQENTGFCREGYEGHYNVYMMEELQTVISMGVGGVTKLVKGDRIERIFNIKDVREYIKRLDELVNRKQFLYEFFK
ncbi:MAG: coproporphyrinogen dehydrogenase HemZ [Clostridia bacterium]|nr:coproporphyrinogen dehydrogenase HemZ [Clostridia bacterium]